MNDLSSYSRRVYQLRLFELYDDFDHNGHWYVWRLWDGAWISAKTYRREKLAGSDCIQDGKGCPVDWLSDEAYARLLATLVRR